jgi:hypothetical protein
LNKDYEVILKDRGKRSLDRKRKRYILNEVMKRGGEGREVVGKEEG